MRGKRRRGARGEIGGQKLRRSKEVRSGEREVRHEGKRERKRGDA